MSWLIIISKPIFTHHPLICCPLSKKNCPNQPHTPKSRPSAKIYPKHQLLTRWKKRYRLRLLECGPHLTHASTTWADDLHDLGPALSINGYRIKVFQLPPFGGVSAYSRSAFVNAYVDIQIIYIHICDCAE